MDKKTLKQAVGKTLEAAGFVKKGQTWYFAGPELIGLVELQKCDWADYYFMNLGFFIKSLDPSTQFPLEQLCHLRYRAEVIFPEVNDDLEAMLSLGDGEDSDERLEQLKEFVAKKVGPFVASINSISALKALASTDWFRHGFVHVEARKVLGLIKV